ncbi:Fic family protein [Arthrobacter sp. KBS0702]
MKAAVLLESAARNHPLVDGNKRTSFDPDGAIPVAGQLPARLQHR